MVLGQRPLADFSLNGSNANVLGGLPSRKAHPFADQTLGLLKSYLTDSTDTAAAKALALLDQMSRRVAQGSSLKNAFLNLPLNQSKFLETQLGGSQLKQLLKLGDTAKGEIFWPALFHFSQRQKALSDPKARQWASQAFGLFLQNKSGAPAGLRAEAIKEYNAMLGRGDPAYQGEFLAQRLLRDATSWKMIGPMVLASPVYHLGKVATLKGLLASSAANPLTRGIGLKALPVTLGFGLETTFFSLSSRSLTHFFETKIPWDARSVAKDWLAATMTLGVLKGGGHLGRQFTMARRGLHGKPATAWTQGDRRALWWSSQGSAYLGLVGAHGLETQLGLRPHIEGSNIWLDAFATHLALGMGTRLGRTLLGPGFAAAEHRLVQEAHRLYLKNRPEFSFPGFGGALFAMAGGPQGPLKIANSRSTGPGRKLPDHVAAIEDQSNNSDAQTLPAGTPKSLPSTPLKGKYVVIGNRGEAAVRAAKTAKEMGAIPIVYVSDADRESLHASMEGVLPIYLQGKKPSDTYENITKRLSGLQDLIVEKNISPENLIAWEGWGHLSRDPNLFSLYKELGIKFSGGPEKIQPSAKKMELVYSHRAGREVENEPPSDSHGREKALENGRHLQEAFISDGKGNLVLLGERDTTIQGVSQGQGLAVLEVSHSLDPRVREAIWEYTELRAKQEDLKDYQGPGTMEFLWQPEAQKLYFLGVKTGLESEHTVTELVTGKNLLKAQLELAAGLPLTFQKVQPEGHAIQLKITTENPSAAGRILHLKKPDTHPTDRIQVRFDTGIAEGAYISGQYNPLLAVLNVRGKTWADALEGVQKALKQTEILGLKTNLPVLKALVGTEEFQQGEIPNAKWLEEVFLKSEAAKPNYKDEETTVLAAAVQTYLARRDILLRNSEALIRGQIVNPKVDLEVNGRFYGTEVYEYAPGEFLVRLGNTFVEVGLVRQGSHLYKLRVDGQWQRSLIQAGVAKRTVQMDNVDYTFKVIGEGRLGPGKITAPMPGNVVKILVEPGQEVKENDPLLVIEAMKMENEIGADVDGTVKEIKVELKQDVKQADFLVDIIPTKEAQAKAEESEKAKAVPVDGFHRDLAFLTSLGEGKINELNPKQKNKMQDLVRAYFKGFDAPHDLLIKALPFLKPRGTPKISGYSGEQQAARQWLGELLESFQTVESLFSPTLVNYWALYRTSGFIGDKTFESYLKKALKLHGIEELDGEPNLENSLQYLDQSHKRRREKAEILEAILPWIPEFEMEGLAKDLSRLEKLYVSQIPRDFSTKVAEAQEELNWRVRGENAVHQAFEKILQGTGGSRDQAVEKFFSLSGKVLPYLFQEALKTRNPVSRNEALKLIHCYFHDEFYHQQGVYTAQDGLIFDLAQKAPAPDPSLQVYFTSVSGKDLLPNIKMKIIEAQTAFPMALARDPNVPKVAELVLPPKFSFDQLGDFEKFLTDHLPDLVLDRITLMLLTEKGQPDFRTYEVGKDKKGYVENKLLRGIHPINAEKIGLKRWTDNFNVTRLEDLINKNPHVHPYRAEAKEIKGDIRQFIIGEQRGHLTLKRFDGKRVENLLLKTYRELKVRPNKVLDADSRMAWALLPHVLKGMGHLPEDFDPFSIGVLRSSPKEMVERFDLDERLLRQVAPIYDGLVKSIPEVERVARDTSLVLGRMQTGELAAVADLFIHEPVEVSEAEIILLAYRLAPQFIGRQLEKTTVHFNLLKDGVIRPYIAEIKIPGMTRFEVDIKPALNNPPPHRVRTPIEARRNKQRLIGSEFVYDRVEIVRDVIKDFFPKGNIPAEPVEIKEMILGPENKLISTDREIGKNDINKVAFKVDYQVPVANGTEQTVTRQFLFLCDDWTSKAGAMGRKEGLLHKAVTDYAIENGIPILYGAEGAGAFIGIAKELLPFLEYDKKKDKNFILPEILEKTIPNTEIKVGDLLTVGKAYEVALDDGAIQKRLPVEHIYGIGEINSESIDGAAMAGEAMSRARQFVPTGTVAFRVSQGIATYLARLSDFVIMVEGSYLGLTGFRSINGVLGTSYTSEQEVHGDGVMRDNGVAYKVVAGEREAFQAWMKFLSYLPARKGEEAPIAIVPDPATRDIGSEVQQLIEGAGKRYDTKALDQLVMDPGSVWYLQDDGFYGRNINVGFARLGGIPVGYASMEMAPKRRPGETKDFAGALDPQSSQKFWSHVRFINRLGLDLVFNGSLTGFMPRREDHDNRVVPEGADILHAWREFNQAIVSWTPPYGKLYGGAWAVIHKNINPNIASAADVTAELGIMGAAGENKIPLATKHHKTQGSTKVLKLLEAQNSPLRASKVGSIHRVIEDSGKTPGILHELLVSKRSEIQQRRESAQERADLTRQVTGVLDLLKIPYRLEGDQIEWGPEGNKHRSDLPKAKAILEATVKELYKRGAPDWVKDLIGWDFRQTSEGEEGQ